MTSKDIIFINNLVINTVIGVYPHEHQAKQELILDFELQIDAKKAALSDDLSDTIDYDFFTEWLTEQATQKKFNLIETLAEFLCKTIIETFHIPKVKLKITKPYAITATRNLGVIIERGFQDYNFIERPASTAII